MSGAVITKMMAMTRWAPNAPGRLRQAALELYAERGFEQTTVAEIAERAGLTERTFFRYFADKREVLFSGSELLQERMTDAVAGAPATAGPMEAVAAGLEAAATFLQDGAEFSHQRQLVIAANPELQERELIKLASLAAALAAALRARGVGDPAATLSSEIGVAVFRTAFERWHQEDHQRTLSQLMQASLSELAALTAGAPAAGSA